MITHLLGKKIGMSQVFDEKGNLLPVTVLQVGPCSILQVKKSDGKDRYNAIQVGFEEKKIKQCVKPEIGHAKKAGKTPFRLVRELPWDGKDEYKAGDTITVEVFKPYKFVDVIGTSKGKGFQGVVKRHHFAGGSRTHGQSDRERAPGSIGSSAFPSRVRKGMRMGGHMGDRRCTVQGLKVVEVDAEKNLLLVMGAVPGANGSFVEVRRGLMENILAHRAAKKV